MDWRVARAEKLQAIAPEDLSPPMALPLKATPLRAHGAKLGVAGGDPLSAELAARRAAEASGKVFISPYNDADVIAGQGTIAVELCRQLPWIDAMFVAVGGGDRK